MLVNSFCAFLSFRALILVGLLQLHLEAIFTSARFVPTATVSHEAIDFALCLVGMHSTAASRWALTKFSYSSFGVCVSDFSCSVSNLFLRCLNRSKTNKNIEVGYLGFFIGFVLLNSLAYRVFIYLFLVVSYFLRLGKEW